MPKWRLLAAPRMPTRHPGWWDGCSPCGNEMESSGAEAVCGAGREECQSSLLGKPTATERHVLPPSLSGSVARCQALTEQAAGDSSEGQIPSWLQGWVIPLPRGRGEVRSLC